MPYSFPDKIPKVAKKWTEAQQKKCIAAANAVLREKGETPEAEQQAIFACIRAAGKTKRDQIEQIFTGRIGLVNLSQLSQRKLERLNPIVPPRTRLLEAQYFSDIRQVVVTLRELTKEFIIPFIGTILEGAKLLRPDRKDAPSDDIQSVLRVLRIRYNTRWAIKEYERMASDAFSRTNAQSTRYMNRLFNQVANISYAASEPWLDDMAKLFVNENVKLISSIPTDYFSRIEGIMNRNVRKGALVKDTAKEIKKALNISNNRAKLIARDQTNKLYGELQGLRQVGAGIEKYKWSTSQDERVRTSHIAKNRKIFSWNNPPSDTGHPGEDIQCRCVAIPVIK